MSMNIYSSPGDKVMVTYTTAKNGHLHDKEQVRKFLKVPGIYTIKKVTARSWNTEIMLEEVPDVWFNSVNFEDID